MANPKGQDGNVGDRTRGKLYIPSVRLPNVSAGKMAEKGDRNAALAARRQASVRHGAFAK